MKLSFSAQARLGGNGNGAGEIFRTDQGFNRAVQITGTSLSSMGIQAGRSLFAFGNADT